MRSVSSAMAMNSVGVIVAAHRMVPARQRLEADDLAGCDRGLRLVVDLELVVLDRLLELLGEDAALAQRSRPFPAVKKQARARPCSLAR